MSWKTRNKLVGRARYRKQVKEPNIVQYLDVETDRYVRVNRNLDVSITKKSAGPYKGVPIVKDDNAGE